MSKLKNTTGFPCQRLAMSATGCDQMRRLVQNDGANPTRKIVFITGTRADFGKLKPLMRYLEQRSDIELHVIVTGMHMLKLYGSTYLEVKREGFTHIYCVANQHANEPMCSIMGNSVCLFSRLIGEIAPHLIVVHGDRLEALAGATVGALSNTLVCHIEGGELSGTVDDLIRHAVTKLAHIHMVANDDAAARLVQLGECGSNIYVIGSPDLDVMRSDTLPSLQQALAHYQIPSADFAIAMFHPVTSEEADMPAYAKAFFSALEKTGDRYVVVYPNNDAGTSAILAEINRHRENRRFSVFPSIRFEHFLTLLKNANYIIGNSSAGIREAPFYGVPTVNVGTRQSRRYFCESIFNCSYHEQSILDAIHKAKSYTSRRRSMPFGDGNSLEKFALALNSTGFWQTPFQKAFVDIDVCTSDEPLPALCLETAA